MALTRRLIAAGLAGAKHLAMLGLVARLTGGSMPTVARNCRMDDECVEHFYVDTLLSDF